MWSNNTSFQRRRGSDSLNWRQRGRLLLLRRVHQHTIPSSCPTLRNIPIVSKLGMEEHSRCVVSHRLSLSPDERISHHDRRRLDRRRQCLLSIVLPRDHSIRQSYLRSRKGNTNLPRQRRQPHSTFERKLFTRSLSHLSLRQALFQLPHSMLLRLLYPLPLTCLR